MYSREKLRLLLTAVCFITDLTAAALCGQQLVFPALTNYCGVLWFSSSRLTGTVSAFTLVLLAHIYGYMIYREIFFVAGVALCSALLKNILQETLSVVFMFSFFFLLLHIHVMDISLPWSMGVTLTNAIITYFILKLHAKISLSKQS
jgi:hypothetical protein